MSPDVRRWKCCPCCDPGGVAHEDHSPVADGGSFIEEDGHDGPCDIHQGYVRGAKS